MIFSDHSVHDKPRLEMKLYINDLSMGVPNMNFQDANYFQQFIKLINELYCEAYYWKCQSNFGKTWRRIRFFWFGLKQKLFSLPGKVFCRSSSRIDRKLLIRDNSFSV